VGALLELTDLFRLGWKEQVRYNFNACAAAESTLANEIASALLAAGEAPHTKYRL